MSWDPSATTHPFPSPGSVVSRLLVFSVLWWALTEGNRYNWWFGAIMVVLATLASLPLRSGARLRFSGFIRFVPFFVGQSIKGGIDVARRAFDPNLPVDPAMIDISLRLPDGPARVFLANTLGLLPGTVSVELREDSLRIHALDRSMPVEKTLRTGEDRIARLFGIDL